MQQVREWVTPILVTIAIFLIGGMSSQLSKVDEKLFKHLTNDEIHVVRTTVTSKAEFELMKQMRDDQIKSIKDMVKDELTQLRIELRKR